MSEEQKNEPMQFRLDTRAFKYEEGGASQSVVGAEIAKVEYDVDYGFKTWFKDCLLPLNGFPDARSPLALTACDSTKKYIKTWLKFFSAPPMRYMLALAVFWPRKSLMRAVSRWVEDVAEFSIPTLKEYVYKPEYYSRAVKQVYGAVLSLESLDIFSFVRPETFKNLADMVCSILEYDRPYRYRLQDIFSIVDREKLHQNAPKEVRRVMFEFARRDRARDWSRLGWLVYASVLLFLPIRKILVRIVDAVEQKYMDLDDNDKYHCYLNLGYEYSGLHMELRMQTWSGIHEKAVAAIPK